MYDKYILFLWSGRNKVPEGEPSGIIDSSKVLKWEKKWVKTNIFWNHWQQQSPQVRRKNEKKTDMFSNTFQVRRKNEKKRYFLKYFLCGQVPQRLHDPQRNFVLWRKGRMEGELQVVNILLTMFEQYREEYLTDTVQTMLWRISN